MEYLLLCLKNIPTSPSLLTRWAGAESGVHGEEAVAVGESAGE